MRPRGLRPWQVAVLLILLYRRHFGGKPKGRFCISWSTLKHLGGLAAHSTSIEQKIAYECLVRGYGLMNLGDLYALVPVRIAARWRRAPRKAVDDLLASINWDVPRPLVEEDEQIMKELDQEDGSEE